MTAELMLLYYILVMAVFFLRIAMIPLMIKWEREAREAAYPEHVDQESKENVPTNYH